MDLNAAMEAAYAGATVRDDGNMLPGWTVRLDAATKLLHYHNPKGEKAHLIKFTNAHRASTQWRIVQ